jgi:hypothetical protein
MKNGTDHSQWNEQEKAQKADNRDFKQNVEVAKQTGYLVHDVTLYNKVM